MSFDRQKAELVKPAERRASITSVASLLAATWFGLGYFRPGPGTIATATALPIYWLLRFTSMPVQVAAIAAVALLAIPCAHSVAIDRHEDDPQIVVIDEVAGALIALLLVDSSSAVLQLACLALFRVVDIFKPWPVSQHVSDHVGFNIVCDDAVAGICAGVLVRLLAQLLQ